VRNVDACNAHQAESRSKLRRPPIALATRSSTSERTKPIPRPLPLQGLLQNIEQRIHPSKKRLYLTREQALDALRQITGKEFETNEEWRAYLSSISFNPNNIDSERAD